MNDLQVEIAELKSFVAELKADRAAQKEKEQKEAWTKYTSLSLVILAVLAAVATQWSGKYSTRTLVSLNDSTFRQSQASDEWSFYQAKSIKQNLYEVARDQIQATSHVTSVAADAKTLEAISAKIQRYGKEKDEIQEKAKKLEAQRDASRNAAEVTSRHGSDMGLSVSIFQISIAMGSITLVVKKRPFWFVSLALGALATAQMILVWMR